MYGHIKITKSCFCLKKIIFRSKFQKKNSLKHPKVRPFLEYLSQAVPKVQENKVFWIYLNFSKMESAVMSVDVSLRSEKRISVHCTSFLSAIFKMVWVIDFTFEKQVRSLLDSIAPSNANRAKNVNLCKNAGQMIIPWGKIRRTCNAACAPPGKNK